MRERLLRWLLGGIAFEAVKVLHIQPGDTLLLKLNGTSHVPHDAIQRVTELWGKQWEGKGVKTLVMESSADVEVLRVRAPQPTEAS